MKRFACIVAALFAAMSGQASAAPTYAFGFSDYTGEQSLVVDGATTVLTNGFEGWVSDYLTNVGGPTANTNYIAGNFDGVHFNDYFVFDISGLTSAVSSASLDIPTFVITDSFTYRIGAASDLVPLLNGALSPSAALYGALGSGTLYGTFGIGSADSNTLGVYALNAAGLADLNAAISAGDQYFAIGGSVTSAPEPATWGLLVVGFGAVGAALRSGRKRRDTGSLGVMASAA